MSGYIKAQELYYSEFLPNGIYAHYENNCVSLPIPDSLSQANAVPLVKNILTHELFYCKKLYIDSSEQKTIIINEILNPSSKFASWPVDLLSISVDSEKTDNVEPLYVRHFYCDKYHNSCEAEANYLLLFPYLEKDSSGRGGYEFYTSLDNWYKNESIKNRNYKNDKIKLICKNIAYAFSNLNKDGYTYFDFSLSRFMLQTDFSVMLEYSNLILGSYSRRIRAGKHLSVQYDSFPLDFMDPYIYIREYNESTNPQNTPKNLNQESQNYSLAAMLFFLMFGRKPYEGQRLMQNQDNIFDEVSHYAYLKNYYMKEENIHFIFDDTYDNPNLLNTDYTDMFAADINLWQECPENIRKLFNTALNRRSAFRDPYVSMPKPETWMKAFESIGWGIQK